MIWIMLIFDKLVKVQQFNNFFMTSNRVSFVCKNEAQKSTSLLTIDTEKQCISLKMLTLKLKLPLTIFTYDSYVQLMLNPSLTLKFNKKQARELEATLDKADFPLLKAPSSNTCQMIGYQRVSEGTLMHTGTYLRNYGCSIQFRQKQNSIKIITKKQETIVKEATEVTFLDDCSGLKFSDGSVFYMWLDSVYRKWKLQIGQIFAFENLRDPKTPIKDKMNRYEENNEKTKKTTYARRTISLDEIHQPSTKRRVIFPQEQVREPEGIMENEQYFDQQMVGNNEQQDQRQGRRSNESSVIGVDDAAVLEELEEDQPEMEQRIFAAQEHFSQFQRPIIQENPQRRLNQHFSVVRSVVLPISTGNCQQERMVNEEEEPGPQQMQNEMVDQGQQHHEAQSLQSVYSILPPTNTYNSILPFTSSNETIIADVRTVENQHHLFVHELPSLDEASKTICNVRLTHDDDEILPSSLTFIDNRFVMNDLNSQYLYSYSPESQIQAYKILFPAHNIVSTYSSVIYLNSQMICRKDLRENSSSYVAKYRGNTQFTKCAIDGFNLVVGNCEGVVRLFDVRHSRKSLNKIQTGQQIQWIDLQGQKIICNESILSNVNESEHSMFQRCCPYSSRKRMKKIGKLKKNSFIQFVKGTPYVLSLGKKNELLLVNTDNFQKESKIMNENVEYVTGQSGGAIYRANGKYYNYS